MRRWEDNIRMDLWDCGREVLDWMHRVPIRERWRAAVITVMNLWFHKRRGIS